MIYPAKYNGINFSYDFSRKSQKYNFDNQRTLNIVNRDIELNHLSFFRNGFTEVETVELTIYSKNSSVVIEQASEIITLIDGYLIKIIVQNGSIIEGEQYMKVQINNDVIYSEIFIGKNTSFLTENEICQITAYNNDSRHGYITEDFKAFGFFKFSKIKSDIFLNNKVEYNYSYSRKKILSSENQIGKRFTFLDLSMYNQNLLKWLCNCENLFIDGVVYQLISDFTEFENDLNSEIINLQADFVEVNQSFFGCPSIEIAKNVFTNQFFTK